MYERVIPRDLFNESKLLKCLGQLSLLIHNGRDDNGRQTPQGLTIEHDQELGDGFEIDQHAHSGDIYCRNINVRFKGEKIDLCTGLNSREAYPLIFDDGGDVFNDNGTFADDFIDYLETL